MRSFWKQGTGLAVCLVTLGALAAAPVARADLAVGASCAGVPLETEIDRAAAAAALPTFVGVDQICALQALLATTGNLPGSRVVDGRYDRQTRDALKTFQTANAVPSNGLLTPETMDLLASAALDQIYGAEGTSSTTAVVTSAPTATTTTTTTTTITSSSGQDGLVPSTISDALAALELVAPVAEPVLTLAPAPRTIELPTLERTPLTLDLTANNRDDSLATLEAPAPLSSDPPVLSSANNGEGGTITRATSTVAIEQTVEERQQAVEDFLAETALAPLGETTLTTSTTTETIETTETVEVVTNTTPEVPVLAPVSNVPDPLDDSSVRDFVEPSICHDPASVRDRDILRNQSRLPTATCLRVFEGAGNLPYRIYSLEANDSGPTILITHDGDDTAFDAAVAALGRFGGRLIALQSGENTRTTLQGANTEILSVSPTSNAGCEWSDVEKPLAFAVHDYVVAGAAPIMVLRANETRQSILDRFSDGKVRFDLSNLGPTREVFSPTIEPLADQAFLEVMVTSPTRRSAETRALVKAGIETGLPVALTLVDAMGNRDQCSIEALALQTDQPVMRLLMGKARGERAANLVATAVAAAGMEEVLLQTGPLPTTAVVTTGDAPVASIGVEGDIPAEILALAAGGLDADFSDNLTLQNAAPRTEVAALAPGLPPLPLDRPEDGADNPLLASVETSANRAPTNRIVSGIAAGSGVDALAPVALAGEGGFSVSAEVALGETGVIVEEAVGPVTALPPSPILRPASDLPHRLIADGTDPILAMLGEEYYRLEALNNGSTTGQRVLTGTQYYDPNAAPRVISTRTINTTVSPGYTAPGYTAPGYTAPVQGYTTVPSGTGGVSGPLYSNTVPQQPQYVPTAPAAETVIINNSLF